MAKSGRMRHNLTYKNQEMDERNDFEKQYDGLSEFYEGQNEEDDNLKNILQILEPKSKILDLGCGVGHDSNAFMAAGMDVIGIDFSSELIEKARELYPGVNIQAADFLRTDFGEIKFDLVWCKFVFHHIPYCLNDTFIETVKKILKPNGLFYLATMVAEQELDGWVKMDWETKKGNVATNTYWKAMTKEKMENLLKKHKFDIIEKNFTEDKGIEYVLCRNRG